MDQKILVGPATPDWYLVLGLGRGVGAGDLECLGLIGLFTNWVHLRYVADRGLRCGPDSNTLALLVLEAQRNLCSEGHSLEGCTELSSNKKFLNDLFAGVAARSLGTWEMA